MFSLTCHSANIKRLNQQLEKKGSEGAIIKGVRETSLYSRDLGLGLDVLVTLVVGALGTLAITGVLPNVSHFSGIGLTVIAGVNGILMIPFLLKKPPVLAEDASCTPKEAVKQRKAKWWVESKWHTHVLAKL